jgi:hypothetical protein
MKALALASSFALATVAAPVFAVGSPHAAEPVSKGTAHSAVEVKSASPIHRTPKQVAHRHSSVHSWVEPVSYLPVTVWAGVALPRLGPINQVWEQEQIVDPVDGWSELIYQVPSGGSSLLLSFNFPMQFDFAEIVYQDGLVQTVDLAGPSRTPAAYTLADIDPTRVVDHVRIIAQATDSVAYLQVLAK